jgi:competence protein ComEC
VDLYLTTHHGLDQSNAPELVHALNPRVAIMNNGARKGGNAPAWQAVKASPRLQDMWQVHFALAGGKENNVQDMFIANTEERGTEHYLKVSATQTGGMEVTNSRNNFKKSY